LGRIPFPGKRKKKRKGGEVRALASENTGGAEFASSSGEGGGKAEKQSLQPRSTGTKKRRAVQGLQVPKQGSDG